MDRVAGTSFEMYAKSGLLRFVCTSADSFKAYPSLLRFKGESDSEDKPILGGRLLALCETV
jgi:hypothetical protein